MKKLVVIIAILSGVAQARSQLNVQPGARINLNGAVLTATGNVFSATTILGTGMLAMRGTAVQQLNLNGNSLPTLTIQNPAGIQLTGNVQVNTLLNFISGKIFTSNFFLALGNVATINGAGTGKFVETAGTGQLKKVLTAAIADYSLAVGNGSNYTPVSISSSGTFSNASIGVNSTGIVHPQKPAGATNYLNTYWTIKRAGITGTVNATATYTPANVTGTETSMFGYIWNGASWSKSGVTINYASNQVSSPIAVNQADLYAMSDAATASALLLNDKEKISVLSRNGLFPNPAGNRSLLNMNMDHDGFVNISVYDDKGLLVSSKEVFFHKGSNQYSMNLTAYKNGVFGVSVRAPGQSSTFMLIKK